MRGGWGCAWNSPCAWLLLAPPPEAPLWATVIRLSGLEGRALPGQDGRPAWRAECGLTQPLPTLLPRRPGAGLPAPGPTAVLAAVLIDRCPCRCPCCSPLGLRFRVTARGVLGKSSGSFCFEPGPDLSHGEEETGILLGCEDGIRGSAFLGFGVPSHWRESQAKGSCAYTAGVDHARVGGSLRGCPGRRSLCGLRLRGPAPQRPAVRVACSGPARRSHAPAGLWGVRAQQPAVPWLRRTARNDTRPLNAPDRGEGFICWFLLSSAGLRGCRSSVMCSQTQNSKCIIGPFSESFTEMISFRTLEDSLFLCSKEFWGIVKEVHI